MWRIGPDGGDWGSVLAPWAGLGGGALAAPFGFGGGALGQAMGELGRLQARALAALPSAVMKVDIVESDAEVRLVADLPGVAMKDVKLDVGDDNVLRICAKKQDECERDETRGGVTYHCSERSSGCASRAIQLPAHLDSARISARLDNGVLTVVVPKVAGAEAGGRRIAVQQGGAAPRLGAANA